MALSRNQIYKVVREAVAAVGNIPADWSQQDLEAMKISDLRFDKTNIKENVGQKDFFSRLQNGFKGLGFQLELLTKDVFKNTDVESIGDIIDLCADNLSPI